MSGPVKCIWFAVLLVISSCASVTPPTGGPRDETPPKLETTVPANQSLNYTGRIVAMEFDEQVELRDLQKELIITPYTENPYKTKVDKNKIKLEFEKPLEPNTTYTFNFRKSIRDLTEANPADIPPLTFSTGSFLDSGTVSGSVVQLLTQKPEGEADILLYRATDTGSVRTTKPFYVSRTDAAGTFRFTNIATGAYRIYALTDKNNSLTYDQDIERIGYLADTIRIDAKTAPIQLSTVRIDTRKPFIVKRTAQTDRADVEYNEGLSRVRLLNQPSDSLIYFLHQTGRTALVFRKPEQKELSFIIQATDSAGFQSTDTVLITFTRPFRQDKFVLSVKDGSPMYTTDRQIQLSTERPVATIKPGSIKVLIDSVVIHTVPVEKVAFDDSRRTLNLPAIPLPKTAKTFDLVIDTAGVTSINQQSSQAFRYTFQVATGSNTGSLQGRVITSHPSYILQLLDRNYQVIKQNSNPKTFNYQNLTPGSYKLRLIVDKNKNGVWDNGGKDLKTLPEPVIYHKEDIDIRANWQLEDIVFSTEQPVENPAKK